jgi:hypothetical protein
MESPGFDVLNGNARRAMGVPSLAARPPEAAVSALDWGIIGFYLVCALGLGLYMGRRGSRNMAAFFVEALRLARVAETTA